jgi:hypothetical protein
MYHCWCGKKANISIESYMGGDGKLVFFCDTHKRKLASGLRV